MEKLLLLLILNSPDQSVSTKYVETDNCIHDMNVINNDPANLPVYQDELGNVLARLAVCEYVDGTRIVVPTILRKG